MSRIVGFAAGRDVEDGVEAAVACLVVHLDLIISDFCKYPIQTSLVYYLDALHASIKKLCVWEALVVDHNVGQAAVDQLLSRLLVDQADAKTPFQLQHQLKLTFSLFPAF